MGISEAGRLARFIWNYDEQWAMRRLHAWLAARSKAKIQARQHDATPRKSRQARKTQQMTLERLCVLHQLREDGRELRMCL